MKAPERTRWIPCARAVCVHRTDAQVEQASDGARTMVQYGSVVAVNFCALFDAEKEAATFGLSCCLCIDLTDLTSC